MVDKMINSKTIGIMFIIAIIGCITPVMAFSVGSGLHFSINVSNSTNGTVSTHVDTSKNLSTTLNHTTTTNDNIHLNSTNSTTHTNTTKSQTQYTVTHYNTDDSTNQDSETSSDNTSDNGSVTDLSESTDNSSQDPSKISIESSESKTVVKTTENSFNALNIIASFSTIILLGILIFAYVVYRGKNKEYQMNKAKINNPKVKINKKA